MKITILYGTDDDLELLYYTVYYHARDRFVMLDGGAIIKARDWKKIYFNLDLN